MIKCYFTEIDDKFDPNKDIVVGPWCVPSITDAEKIHFVEPYSADEVLTMHHKLFDLSFFLLNKDIEGKDDQYKKKYFLIKQRDYLFFVFVFFSRYRVLKKILATNSISELIFESVPEPQLKENPNYLSYFKLQESAYIISKILDCLIVGNNILKFKNTNKISENNLESIFSNNNNKMFFSVCKQKVKKSLNFLVNVNGVKFFKGFLLSCLYRVLNINKKTNHPIFIFEPKINIDDEEIIEFVTIFEKISPLFIDKQLNNHCRMKKVPRLAIFNPGFIYNDEIINIVDASLKGKTRLIILQHGSYYGTIKKHFAREIEYNLATFFSYGKQITSYLERKNVINFLPNPYLSSIANKYIFKKQNNILWVTGANCKEGDGLELVYGTMVICYMRNKEILYNNLKEDVKKLLLYKTLNDSAIVFHDIMKDVIPKEQQYTSNHNIITCMLNSKIIFLDYYGTPFYEAMSMNVPIILGLLESDPLFTHDALLIFKKFEDAGVVYRNFKDIANFFNQLEHLDIKKWWYDEKIQSIRREFLEKYANNKPYFWPWVKAILKRQI